MKQQVLSVHPGDVVKVDNRVVRILNRADGVMQWRCDDGMVYRQTRFVPATTDEIREHVRAEQAEMMLIGDYLNWQQSHEHEE